MSFSNCSGVQAAVLVAIAMTFIWFSLVKRLRVELSVIDPAVINVFCGTRIRSFMGSYYDNRKFLKRKDPSGWHTLYLRQHAEGTAN
jgi:uncharacterized membrane protein